MEKKKENKPKLSSAEIKKFRAMLIEKRNEILGSVTSMETETLRRERSDLSNLPIHMADMGSDSYEIENTIGLMSSERKILVAINEALDRIENGTYGICEGEGEAIPKARLEAIPWARYCVNCATLLEKGLLAAKDEEDEILLDDDREEQ
ncbi:MAG: TraR/DksA C4-type zinc finger protein [Sedimentisphaerales bacterium]|nr:TraR/DksA C4-type zinc finger protein [Sedimentisphaerales bacterium]